MKRVAAALFVGLLVVGVLVVPLVVTADGFEEGVFPDRVFHIGRSPPGGPKSDTYYATILPAASGMWSVQTQSLSGSSVIVQLLHYDGGMYVQEGSWKLRAVGQFTPGAPLFAGGIYQAAFTPYGKSGESLFVERFQVNTAPISCFTITPAQPVAGDTVTFSASCSVDYDGGIVSYAWDFGDGAAASGTLVTHAYPLAGSYSVTLTVTDNMNAWDTATQTLDVILPANLPPVADFTFSPANPAVFDLVSFDGSLSSDLDGAIVAYAWDFGDGSGAGVVDPSHAFDTEGPFTVTLTVTDDDGATDSASKIILVAPNAAPVADFSWSPLTPKAVFDTVSFSGTSSHDPDGNVVSWSWDFGDGGLASGSTADHAYASAGDYPVTLAVTDNKGASGSLTQTIHVVENLAPVAALDWSPLAPKEGQEVSFTAASSSDPDGSIVSYVWDFGDGGSASGMAAVHSFAAGTYAVHLTVTDDNGATGVAAADLVVAANLAPVACFSFAAEGIMVGAPVAFDATCSNDPDGAIVSWSWDFGDGATDSGTTVQHAFLSSGDFAVTLTVTDDSDVSAALAQTVHVTQNEIPVAVIAYSPGSPLSLVTVTFDGSGSYDPLPPDVVVSYAWTFSDDASSASGAVVSHVFAHPGTWAVTLEVTDTHGAKGAATVNVVVANRAPTAALSVDLLSVLTGEIVTADASLSSDADGTIVSYEIAWGDGAIASDAHATHAFADNGAFAVTLTVMDDSGATAQASQIVTVADRPPVADLQVSPDHGVVGTVFTADASASSDPDGFLASMEITWGDGAVSDGPVATHAYSSNAVYTIVLTVTDDDGQSATASATVAVENHPPVAQLQISPGSVLTGEIVTADASLSSDPDGDALTYLVAWGDGATSSTAVVDHAYSEDGTFTVTLTVTDPFGAWAQATQAVTVADRPPVAVLHVSPDYGALDTVFTADTAGSSDPDGSIVAYEIAWGDGATSAEPTATHVYSLKGTYTIVLTVTDDDGNIATASAAVTVANQPPVASLDVSPATVLTGEAVTADASASSDPDGDALTYLIAWGDGATSSTVVADHVYADNGVFTITLTVTDSVGASAQATEVVTVLNRAPTASLSVDPSGALTLVDVAADASASSDPDGWIASFTIDWGDGAVIHTASGVHSYAHAGVYAIWLTIVDNDGASASASSSVSISDRAPVAAFTFSPASPSHGVPVGFDASGSSDPDGLVVGFAWDFGDGQFGSGPAVSHAFAAPGTYTVVLTVTDNDGSTASIGHAIVVVNQKPVAQLDASPLTLLTGESVTADALGSYDPDGDALTFEIAWGDGATSSAAVADHAYADNGVFTITLTVTDAFGASASATAAVTVLNRPPTATLSVDPTAVLTLVDVTADASGSSDPDGWIASFTIEWGDGSVIHAATGAHSYNHAGTYTVRLTVVDNDGASAIATATVTVSDRPPVAAFTFSPSAPSHAVAVQFDGSGSSDVDGSVLDFAWNFGDGKSGSGAIVSHTFDAPGTYTVTLTVTDNDGSIASVSHDIVVGNLAPVAHLDLVPTTVLTGEAVSADASGSSDPDGDALTYEIAWGDGVVSHSAVANHAYSDDGSFLVVLTVTDPYGGTASTSAMVTVQNRPPVAHLLVSPDTVLTLVDVTADALASSDPDGWIASFTIDWGDGASVNAATGVHPYAHAGVFTVSLTVVDNDGASASASASVTVTDRPPAAAFTFSPASPSHHVTVQFDGSGSSDVDGLIVSYAWTFGDGNSGNGAIVGHAFLAPGTYTVTLTVTDNDGSIASVSHDIVIVNLPPTASLSVTPATVLTGEIVTADASASSDPDGPIVSYQILWGDGASSSTAIATHAYTTNSVFTVTVTVTDAFGAFASQTATVTVLDRAPTAVLSVTPGSVLTGELVTADGSGSSDPDGSIIGYHINWGDGHESFASPATHSYANNGDFTVTLTVTDDDGSVASVAQVVHVANRPPVASFTVSPDPPIAGAVAYFDASGSSDLDGLIASYAWDFGDGTTAAGMQVEKTFAAGTFTVTLTVTDDDGSVASQSQGFEVTSPVGPNPPTPAFTLSRHLLSVHVDASASADPDGDPIVSYEWDWGDGNLGSGSTADHTYAAPGLFFVTLTVSDGVHSSSLSKPASVSTTTVDYTYYDFFNVPYGEWWDMRTFIYGDLPIAAECFSAESIADSICAPSKPDVPDTESYPYTDWYPSPVGDRVIYAPYRFDVQVENSPSYTIDKPVILPTCADLKAALALQSLVYTCPSSLPEGGAVTIEEYMQYTTIAREVDLVSMGCPDLTSSNDGFYMETQMTLTMDDAAAAKLFGVTDPASWAPGTLSTSLLRTGCGVGGKYDSKSGLLEKGVKYWLEYLGNGPYEVFNTYEYPYMVFAIQATGSYDPVTHLHTLVLDFVTWGQEALTARWFYWGATSYKDGLGGTPRQGWWGMELAWFEDFHMTASIDTSFDASISSVMQYSFQHSADPGTDGVYSTADDVPKWMFAPILSDYLYSTTSHPVSELDVYSDYLYVHTTVGTPYYGTHTAYDYVPAVWALVPGETQTFHFPVGNVVLYDPQSPRLTDPLQLIAITAPIAFAYSVPEAGVGSYDPETETYVALGPTTPGTPPQTMTGWPLESRPIYCLYQS